MPRKIRDAAIRIKLAYTMNIVTCLLMLVFKKIFRTAITASPAASPLEVSG
jgi:hypothetical protein